MQSVVKFIKKGFSLKYLKTNQSKNCISLERDIVFNKKRFLISVGDTDRNMHEAIPENGEYELWVTKYFEIVSKYYGNDKDAVDIGANIGIHSLILAELQHQGSVIAFEPLSIAYNQLTANAKRNNINNIIAEKYIIGDKASHNLSIQVPINNNIGGSFVSEDISQNSYIENCESITLDSYLYQSINSFDIKLIKIDVECFEQLVLRGSQQTIKKHNPVVFLEFNVQARDLEAEDTGLKLYLEINTTFKYVFLINRLSHKIMPITCYAQLRGLMLTGHFVEDLLCFNDDGFYQYVSSFISPCDYTTYHAGRFQLSEDKNLAVTSFSHYPDNWCHGHDFFLIATSAQETNVKLTIKNTGPIEEVQLRVIVGNEVSNCSLTTSPLQFDYCAGTKEPLFVYIFILNVFNASEHFNNNDPRLLGLQMDINISESCI